MIVPCGIRNRSSVFPSFSRHHKPVAILLQWIFAKISFAKIYESFAIILYHRHWKQLLLTSPHTKTYIQSNPTTIDRSIMVRDTTPCISLSWDMISFFSWPRIVVGRRGMFHVIGPSTFGPLIDYIQVGQRVPRHPWLYFVWSFLCSISIYFSRGDTQWHPPQGPSPSRSEESSTDPVHITYVSGSRTAIPTPSFQWLCISKDREWLARQVYPSRIPSSQP